ncbi:hypothetical protein KBC04_00755 [Candidatus Babeliales bacterium]|nr:hypothetical protein [Candidatus Babeliales bacterium]MBP9843379.1 hypothetical protein [Candidatus Babeliales bacterium]
MKFFTLFILFFISTTSVTHRLQASITSPTSSTSLATVLPTPTPAAAPLAPTITTPTPPVLSPTSAAITPPAAPGITDTPEPAPTPLSAPAFIAGVTPSTPTPPAITPPVIPSPATSSTTTTPPTTTTTPGAPTPPAPIEQFLTSIYIQNNSKKDAVLHQLELLIANKETPFVKSNLNIQIPATKSLYSRGFITGFDITSPSKDIESFNGVASMTIGDDKISFTNIKTGFSAKKPIKITQKDNHWIFDEK